jgi:hypothetical protein
MQIEDELSATSQDSQTRAEFQGLELQAMAEITSQEDLMYSLDRHKTSRKLLVHGKDDCGNQISYSVYNLFLYLESENYLKQQNARFHNCLSALIKEHPEKWILFEDGRIIHSAATEEELESKVQKAMDLDYYRPADFIAFVPGCIGDLQAQVVAESKSKGVVTVADIFRAASEREKLDIFKEICDLRIQSIGIKFTEE